MKFKKKWNKKNSEQIEESPEEFHLKTKTLHRLHIDGADVVPWILSLGFAVFQKLNISLQMFKYRIFATTRHT